MNWDVWGAPIAVLLTGTFLGLILAYRSRGGSRQDPVAEAWAKKDALMDQLRSHKADQGKLDPEQWDQRWATLLDATARALRDAESMETAPPPTVIDPQEPSTPKPSNRKTQLAWVVGTLLFFAALGAILQQSIGVRQEGGTMTGGAIVSGETIETQVKNLQARHKEDPTDIDPLNGLASIALSKGDLGGAMKWIDAARKIDPDDPTVHTHLAILQISVGMNERAKTELEAALEIDPTLSKALLWRGLIELRAENREEAVSYLEKALENATSREDRYLATQGLSEARKPPAVPQLKGTISLNTGVSRPGGGILFIMVRRSADGSGPPVAAVRLDARGIPGAFTVTDRDLMMGGAWPDQVWIEARVDMDGDPLTKTAADLTAPLMGPLGPGTEGISLVLDNSATTTETETQAPTAQLSGSLSMADGVSQPTKGTIFIIVRRTETPQGPPVAALRLPATAAPGDFSVTKADMMLGGEWPTEVWVQARVDSDGNAMTKEDTDISSTVVGPLDAGATDVQLILGN
ncbi:MAG: tetratricopeptide repeat protein [Myxococcota bacterium]